MKFAIFGKRRQSPHDVEKISRLFALLEDRGAYIAVQESFFDAMTSLLGYALPADDVFDTDSVEADVAVSIGGDGTFLRTARRVGARRTPIVGFNTGHLGFLAEESLDDANTVVDYILEGDYFTEPRSLLRVRAACQGGPNPLPDWDYALNEVAVLRHDSASMIKVKTLIDDIEIATYQGDGLIISTPTGSTAYNLSVGGPIVQPTAPCWVLSPVAPHALTMRPLVVSDSHVAELSVDSRADTFRVNLDGRLVVLPTRAKLIVEKAPWTVNVIHRPGHTFVDTLSSKLLWGISKR